MWAIFAIWSLGNAGNASPELSESTAATVSVSNKENSVDVSYTRNVPNEENTLIDDDEATDSYDDSESEQENDRTADFESQQENDPKGDLLMYLLYFVCISVTRYCFATS